VIPFSEQLAMSDFRSIEFESASWLEAPELGAVSMPVCSGFRFRCAAEPIPSAWSFQHLPRGEVEVKKTPWPLGTAT